MDKKTLIARLRQIQVLDMNALVVYSELAKSAKDDGQRKVFSGIANDEKCHVALGKKMLSLLEE